MGSKQCQKTSLKLGEGLVSLAGGRENSENVESNGLGQRSALANSDNVALLDSESGRNVGSKVLVSLLVSVVLGNVVQVLPSDDDGSVHFGGDNLSGEDLASDGDIANKGTLLVNVVAGDGRLGGLEAEADLLIPSLGLSVNLGLLVLEDVRLLR